MNEAVQFANSIFSRAQAFLAFLKNLLVASWSLTSTQQMVAECLQVSADK